MFSFTENLRSYVGESMPIWEEINVEVKYGSQVSMLTLTIVEGSGPSLFGRGYLRQLCSDWKTKRRHHCVK